MKAKIIRHYLQLLFRPKFRTRAQLERYQQRQLRRFEREVLCQSPYYNAQLTAGRSIDELPVIGKREFMEHFNTINTAGLDRDTCMEMAVNAERSKTFDSQIGEYSIGLSTGTSGNRGMFVTKEDERAQWVANIFYRVVKPKLFQRQRVAFCLRANSKLYESVRSAAFSFRFYDIAEPLPQIRRALVVQRPDILCAQPSLLRELVLSKIEIAPKQVISYAEVLTPEDRTLIEAYFGTRITEIYQCTEGFLGHTCTHGTLHLNEDLVHVERQMIDERRFQPILTDFTRRTQPVVRYLLNDVLVLRETACPCGSPATALDRIEGRADDVLRLGGQAIFSDLIRRRIVLASNDLKDYAVHQTTPDRLLIYLQTGQFSESKQLIERSFRKWLAERGIKGIELIFHNELPPHEPGTKLRRIRNLVPSRHAPTVS